MNPIFDKPYALAMGPQRCGTRWLEAYLRGRGDVCLPDVKEIFYFDRHFQRGAEFYTAHFNARPAHVLVMELTTTAFDSPDAPRYAYDLLGPDINLLCPLRDPVMRAWDIYRHHLEYGLVSGGIADAVEQAPQILLASRYAFHLERWLERFGRDRLNIVYYEQLIKDTPGHARAVCDALWLPEKPFNNLPPVPTGGSHPDPQSHAWLKERLSKEQGSLENLLNIKIPGWNP